jgi:hypothetical protein
LLFAAVNWAAVTAIATSILAIGLLGGFAAAVFAAQQARDRELDYFEQLAALEEWGAFDLELIKLLLGRTLVERWETWRPAIHQAHGPGAYPLFEGLVAKLRRELHGPTGGRGT